MSNTRPPPASSYTHKARRTYYTSLKAALVALGVHDGASQRVVQTWADYFASQYAHSRGVDQDESNATFEALVAADLARIWIPPTGAYVALGEWLRPGLQHECPIAAQVFKTHMDQLTFRHAPRNGGPVIARNGFTIDFTNRESTPTGARGGTHTPSIRMQGPCPTCFTTLPSTGICGYCDD